MDQREATAQLAGMLRRLKRNQRVVQPIRLPIRLSLLPTAGMANQSK